MISWLKGEKVDEWTIGPKHGIVLACGSVGYEIQLLQRELKQKGNSKEFIFWIHHMQRDETIALFGFAKKEERDFFRILISVNGVGPQIAISLLEIFEVQELSQAILEKDFKKLSKGHGVGKRTAERIAIELNNKLKGFISSEEESHSMNTLTDEILLPQANKIEELKNILISLGYEELEIRRAIKAIGITNSLESEIMQLDGISSNEEMDKWLKKSLIWLSQESA